jgi:glutathione reductase (NADPH)
MAGARSGLAEEYRFGGTCVIRGCVPKKLLVYGSGFPHEFEDAKAYGWTVDSVSFDWPTLRDNIQNEVSRLSGIYINLLDSAGVEHVHSRAVLEDANTVRLVSEGRTVTARSILVATGGWPYAPHIAGHEHIITSNEIFTLETLPESIAIVGGGYIAIEFAFILAGLGVDVTVIYRGNKLLRGFDEDLRDHVGMAARNAGIRTIFERTIARIDEAGGGRKMLSFGEGGDLLVDQVMFATGRMPLTANMGLEKAGVELGRTGEIVVDEFSRSTVPSIYAVGDVTNRVNLTPVAIDEAMCFVDTVFKDNPRPVDHSYIPTAVFSQPEIGTVGMGEEEAREQYGRIDIYKSTFRPMKQTLSMRDEKMLMKLVVDADGGRVLGCHLMGPDAAEMAQILAIPMRMGATKADFDATMALHPTAAEELVTMRQKWVPPED